jgi:hypothetical protein
MKTIFFVLFVLFNIFLRSQVDSIAHSKYFNYILRDRIDSMLYSIEIGIENFIDKRDQKYLDSIFVLQMKIYYLNRKLNKYLPKRD